MKISDNCKGSSSWLITRVVGSHLSLDKGGKFFIKSLSCCSLSNSCREWVHGKIQNEVLWTPFMLSFRTYVQVTCEPAYRWAHNIRLGPVVGSGGFSGAHKSNTKLPAVSTGIKMPILGWGFPGKQEMMLLCSSKVLWGLKTGIFWIHRLQSGSVGWGSPNRRF